MSCRFIVKCYFYLIPFYDPLYMLYIRIVISKQFVLRSGIPHVSPHTKRGAATARTKANLNMPSPLWPKSLWSRSTGFRPNVSTYRIHVPTHNLLLLTHWTKPPIIFLICITYPLIFIMTRVLNCIFSICFSKNSSTSARIRHYSSLSFGRTKAYGRYPQAFIAIIAHIVCALSTRINL